MIENRALAVIREARPGDESAIHEAHMRSIREICVKDHGEDEVRGWGNRPLGDRWIQPIREGFVWVVEHQAKIYGHGYIRIFDEEGKKKAHIYGLYLTPEVLGQGFGAKLMELMLKQARCAGVRLVTLHSSITAHSFYKRIGFSDHGPSVRRDIGGSLVTGFPMKLELVQSIVA